MYFKFSLILILFSCQLSSKKSLFGKNLFDNIETKQNQINYEYSLIGKDSIWEQSLKFNFSKNKDSIFFQIESKNNENQNFIEFQGIAKKNKDSEYGSESISDDESYELIFVHEYLFYYKNNMFSINLEKRNFKRAQLIPKSIESQKMANFLNFEITMRSK